MAEVVAQCAAREVRTPTQYVARRMEVLGVARERGRLVGEQTEQSFVPRRTWTRRPEPVGTAATPFSRSSLPSVALPIGRPERFGTFGNTSPLGSAIRTRLVEDGQAASLSGTRCSTAALHARGRDRPQGGVDVHLVPGRAADFPVACRREDRESEGEVRAGPRVRRGDDGQGTDDLAVRQRPVVASPLRVTAAFRQGRD